MIKTFHIFILMSKLYKNITFYINYTFIQFSIILENIVIFLLY